MERPDKKYLTKSEFAAVYPEVFEYIESLPIVDNPEGRRNPSSGQIYRGRYLECCVCGKVFYKDNGNIWQDCGRDGKFRCWECVKRNLPYSIPSEERALIKKNYWDNMSTEERDRVRSNMRNSKTEEVYSEASRKREANRTREERLESFRKACETKSKRGTWNRNWKEIECDNLFGSVHLGALSMYDGECLKYEIDCFWPDKKLGVEFDDKSHREVFGPISKNTWHGRSKSQGYHKDKDEYFKSLGITILHITDTPKEGGIGWRGVVQSFLDGTYTGPLIDLTDPTYGDIIY